MKREGLDTIEALLYLAHYWKELGQMAEAEHYCLRLLDFAGKVRAHAHRGVASSSPSLILVRRVMLCRCCLAGKGRSKGAAA